MPFLTSILLGLLGPAPLLATLIGEGAGSSFGLSAAFGPVLFLGSLLGIYLLGHLVYFVISLPLRRGERARVFLHLIEIGLREGRSPEAAVRGAAESRDYALGVGFHLLAVHIERGLRLGAALEAVPTFLPRRVQALFKAGDRLGDWEKVLSLSRPLLRDGISQVRGALNYLLVLAFVLTPAFAVVLAMSVVFVYPRIKAILADMTDEAVVSTPLLDSAAQLAWVQVLLVVIFYGLGLVYAVGPVLTSRFGGWLGYISDLWSQWLAWKRNRLRRDFSAMLAYLVDAGLPESEAVREAGLSTGNRFVIARAQKVAKRLSEGVSLPEALGEMERAGEFSWRLRNALGRRGRFYAALSGWLEALDAKAFQQEQAAAHVVTTSLVFVNGILVGLFAIGLMQVLVGIINAGVLW